MMSMHKVLSLLNMGMGIIFIIIRIKFNLSETKLTKTISLFKGRLQNRPPGHLLGLF